MSLFFTLQFGISGYTIYTVPWLGWDLVEPLTFTITQGSMIGGLFFMYRNRNAGTEFTQLDEFMREKRSRRYREKYDFDLQRMHFLKSRIESLDE